MTAKILACVHTLTQPKVILREDKAAAMTLSASQLLSYGVEHWPEWFWQTVMRVDL